MLCHPALLVLMQENLRSFQLSSKSAFMARRKLVETTEQLKGRRLLAVLDRSLHACVGWSQKDLAKQLDISPASIAKFETGELRINADKKEELLRLFKKPALTSSTLQFLYRLSLTRN